MTAEPWKPKWDSHSVKWGLRFKFELKSNLCSFMELTGWCQTIYSLSCVINLKGLLHGQNGRGTPREKRWDKNRERTWIIHNRSNIIIRTSFGLKTIFSNEWIHTFSCQSQNRVVKSRQNKWQTFKWEQTTIKWFRPHSCFIKHRLLQQGSGSLAYLF